MITLRAFLLTQYKDAKKKYQTPNILDKPLTDFEKLGYLCRTQFTLDESINEIPKLYHIENHISIAKRILRVAYNDEDVYRSIVMYKAVKNLFSNNPIPGNVVRGVISSYKDIYDVDPTYYLYEYYSGVKFISKYSNYFIRLNKDKDLYIARDKAGVKI